MPGATAKVAEAKARRHARSAAGLCYSCGGPRDIAYLRCSKCRSKDVARQKAERGRRIASGTCTQCKSPAVQGHIKCESHMARQRVGSRQAHRRRSPAAKLWAILRNARSRAFAAGRQFSITLDDLLPLPSHCPVLGIELLYSFAGKKGPRSASPSIDRIDNALGYVKGNVRIISARANRIRNDASLDELRAIVRDAELIEARKPTQH